MKIKTQLLVLCVIVLFSCKPNISTETLENSTKPNILIIVIDDAGFADFGFMGSEDLQTPHIDKLANDGVMFTDAHVSATVCAPSRAGLITGKYQQRFGFEANNTGDSQSGEMGLADDVTTIADVFKNENYKTIALGKWHLGSNPDDHPNSRGFEEFVGFIAGSRSYFPIDNPSKNQMLQHNGEKVSFDGYLTDELGDKAVEYIEEIEDQPFLMYLSFNAVHTPMEAKDEHLQKYNDHPRKELAAMTWSLDENIGKIMSGLEATNKLENTLIYFISDNGGAHTNQSDNGPLKGFKGNKFEGGHRVPFIISWKDNIKGNQKFEGLTSSLDIFSTSMAAANINPSTDLNIDGVNLLPYLNGEKQGDPHDKLFWRKLNESGARIGNHKLVRLKGYGSTMYNLNTDIGEMIDISKVDTLNYQKLKSAIENWESDLMSPLWDEEEWMPVTSHIQQRLMENKVILFKSPEERKQYLELEKNN